jgi:hypothetical protein
LLSEAARGVLVDATKETLSTSARFGSSTASRIRFRLAAQSSSLAKGNKIMSLYAKLLQSGGIDGAPLAAQTVGHVHQLLRRAFGMQRNGASSYRTRPP